MRQDVIQVKGACVAFEISPINKPDEWYTISGAFTADNLELSEHTYPVQQLQERYRYLREIPLLPVDHVHPLVLIGSDYALLITATQPADMGSLGGPVAVHTRLGWALQGPASLLPPQQSFLSSLTCLKTELLRNMERLW